MPIKRWFLSVVDRIGWRRPRVGSTGADRRTGQKTAAELSGRRQARECHDYFPGSSGWAGR